MDYAEIFRSQLRAALKTLDAVLDDCPDEAWQESQGDAPFSQVAFHALFYADLYLEREGERFREQAFHREHPELFRDYEEMEDRLPAELYSRGEIALYLKRCLAKADEVLAAEDEASLAGPSGHANRRMSRAELYVYLIRHLQHHAAQLGLRVQLLSGREMKWVGVG